MPEIEPQADQVATIDPNAFAAAFMEALPQEITTLKTKMEDAQARGVAIAPQHFAALDALTDAKNGFCSLWPQANKQLDNIEFWIKFWDARVVAIMNAVEAAINQTVYPMVCGTPVPAKTTVHSNVSQKARP